MWQDTFCEGDVCLSGCADRRTALGDLVSLMYIRNLHRLLVLSFAVSFLWVQVNACPMGAFDLHRFITSITVTPKFNSHHASELLEHMILDLHDKNIRLWLTNPEHPLISHGLCVPPCKIYGQDRFYESWEWMLCFYLCFMTSHPGQLHLGFTGSCAPVDPNMLHALVKHLVAHANLDYQDQIDCRVSGGSLINTPPINDWTLRYYQCLLKHALQSTNHHMAIAAH